MKLNGWQRIGLVIFILWAVCISLFMWSELIGAANSSADFSQKVCGNDNRYVKEDGIRYGTFSIEMPDGTLIKGVPVGSTKENIRLRLELLGYKPHDFEISNKPNETAINDWVDDAPAQQKPWERNWATPDKKQNQTTQYDDFLDAPDDVKPLTSASASDVKPKGKYDDFLDAPDAPKKKKALSYDLDKRGENKETVATKPDNLADSNKIKKDVDYASAADCWQVRKEKYKERKNALIKGALSEDWWIAPTVILTPPLFIGFLWLLSYGVIKIFHWIRAGFSSVPTSTTQLKQSFILTAGIILILVSLLTALHLIQANREDSFKIALAECKLEVIKSKFNDTEAVNYITSCMELKKFKFKAYHDTCGYGIFSMDSLMCYE